MLLMANVLILAHAVIPHHHHDKVAVAIVHLWENEAEHHHSHNEDGHHRHSHDADGHHHEGKEDCFLTEVMEEALVKDSFSEIEAPFHTAELLQQPLPVWEALIADVAPDVDALQYLRHPFRQKPYLTNVYLAFVANQFGFRAPPFC